MSTANNKPFKLTRAIKSEVERELWGRAAARCEFNDCNRLLYKSPVTQEAVKHQKFIETITIGGNHE